MTRLLALLFAGLLVACGAGSSSTELDAVSCSDGIDNDGDGYIDCEDLGCGGRSFCQTGDAGPLGDGAIAPLDSGPRPDTGASSCGDPIDVVFVIDVSTSMTDEVDGIRRGVDSIWNATLALSTNARFGLVVFVDDVVTVNACAPFATVAALQSELMRWQSFTSTNRQPGGSAGTNSDCAENSLDAVYAAATECPWRDGALRILIHVTDDTFAERPAVLSEDFFGGGGVAVQHTYAETSAALVARQIRVGAFAAPGSGEYCGAGSSPDVGRGFHAPYLGMPSLPDATRGTVWSIRDVRAGTLDMARAISEFTSSEYCTLY